VRGLIVTDCEHNDQLTGLYNDHWRTQRISTALSPQYTRLSFRFAPMASVRATAVIVSVIFGCLLMHVLATQDEAGVTYGAEVNRSNYMADNVTQALEGCPPRTHHVGLRYLVAKFNFSHVQTPFIVAAWILFVTLAKIGTPAFRVL